MRKGKRGSAMRTSAKVSRKSTRVKRSKSKSSKKSKGKRGKRGKKGMNAYMKAKEKARKSGAETFTYNGTTYKQATTKTGMVIYKKA